MHDAPLHLAALAVLAAALHADAPPVPRLVGESWIVAGNPHLGDLTTARQQPVDFAIWQAQDGSWQLWSCIRGTHEPGTGRLFHRWTGAALTQPHWRPGGIAMQADPGLGESRGGLQAPHVVPDGEGWLMFYGDWEHICVATSSDGREFTRRPGSDGLAGLFSEGKGWNTRDPMALRVGAQWHCYYTAFPNRQGAVFCRSSPDTRTWSDSRTVAFGGEAGTNEYAAECPFVAEPVPGEYYLFRTQRYGRNAITRVYHSRDPMDFGVNDDSHLVTDLPVAAPEILRHEGQWYIAYLRPALDGIKVSRLKWAPEDRGAGKAEGTPPATGSAPAVAPAHREPVRSFDPPKAVNYLEPARAYVATNAQGWTIHLEHELTDAAAELGARAVARLDAMLGRMRALLPAGSHAVLRRLPVFLLAGEAAAAGGRDNGAEYFQRHAPEHFPLMDPRWGSSLVIYSAKNYVELSDDWALRVLVHEFTHAWQLEQWPETQPDLLAAFRVAMGRGLYRDVRDVNGDVVETAYAAHNALEYFSELSCAYFMRGEYVPFDRVALRDYDPEGFALIEKLWGIRGPPPPATP